MHSSDLEDEIRRLIASTHNPLGSEEDPQRLSCRIDAVRHYQLGILADKMNMTRTGLAEHLLEQATKIAWNAAGFADMLEGDSGSSQTRPKPQAVHQRVSLSKNVKQESSFPTTPPSLPTPTSQERRNIPPDRSESFVFIFRHLGLEIGRVRNTVALSRDGNARVCCLTSKDYEADKSVPLGERYWFTIYERHLEDIEQAQHAYVAFACGSPHQILLVPVREFHQWCDELPPYTQGNKGWHIHLSQVTGIWNIRREGSRTHPIDVTEFMI